MTPEERWAWFITFVMVTGLLALLFMVGNVLKEMAIIGSIILEAFFGSASI